jgi:hypothetical protein
MTRDGFAFRLAEHVKTAATKQPSILGKRAPHVLRHSCAMHTLAATGTFAVALWLGHASIQSTETYLRRSRGEAADSRGARRGLPSSPGASSRHPMLITMLTDVRRPAIAADLARGDCAVVQLVSTSEAMLDRALADLRLRSAPGSTSSCDRANSWSTI